MKNIEVCICIRRYRSSCVLQLPHPTVRAVYMSRSLTQITFALRSSLHIIMSDIEVSCVLNPSETLLFTKSINILKYFFSILAYFQLVYTSSAHNSHVLETKLFGLYIREKGIQR